MQEETLCLHTRLSFFIDAQFQTHDPTLPNPTRGSTLPTDNSAPILLAFAVNKNTCTKNDLKSLIYSEWSLLAVTVVMRRIGIRNSADNVGSAGQTKNVTSISCTFNQQSNIIENHRHNTSSNLANSKTSA